MKISTIPKPKIISYWLIFFVCALFFNFGIFINLKTIIFYAFGETVEAEIYTIIESEDNNFMKYIYYINGERYEKTTEFYSTDYNVGDKLNLYYFKSNPNNCILINQNNLYSLIYIIAFIVPFLIYLFKLINHYKYNNKVKKVLNKSFRIGVIKKIDIKDNLESLGYTPFIIECESNGIIYKSNLLYSDIKDPTSIINYKVKIFYTNDFYYIDFNSIWRE